jgi:hypothetical protein
MDKQSTSKARKRRWRSVMLSLGALLLSVTLCCGLYEYSPAGLLFYYLTASSFEERAEALVPEYDQLNDELWQSLPTYPHATLVPESQRRKGPGYRPVPPGGPGYPRYLYICFSTDDSMEQVVTFYQDTLEKNGWKMFQERIGYDGQFLHRRYTKDRACVALGHACSPEFELDDRTVYEVAVYHDLNVLLGFPRIPKIIYWLEDVEHCP